MFDCGADLQRAYDEGYDAGYKAGQKVTKCSWHDGVTIKPDGINELDPCDYVEIETHTNVTVHVLKCKYCGHVELEWERQS